MLFAVLPQENLFFYHFSPVSKVRQDFLIKRYIIATKPENAQEISCTQGVYV